MLITQERGRYNEDRRNYKKVPRRTRLFIARISGVSNSYLSMLESGRHPRTGRPIVPTLTKINQIADAMGIGVDDLINVMDDTPVRFDSDEESCSFRLSPLEKDIILRFRLLSDGERNMFLRSLGIDDTY